MLPALLSSPRPSLAPRMWGESGWALQMPKLLLFALLGRARAREAGCHENLPPISDTNIEVLEPTAKENWESGQ